MKKLGGGPAPTVVAQGTTRRAGGAWGAAVGVAARGVSTGAVVVVGFVGLFDEHAALATTATTATPTIRLTD